MTVPTDERVSAVSMAANKAPTFGLARSNRLVTKISDFKVNFFDSTFSNDFG